MFKNQPVLRDLFFVYDRIAVRVHTRHRQVSMRSLLSGSKSKITTSVSIYMNILKIVPYVDCTRFRSDCPVSTARGELSQNM